MSQEQLDHDEAHIKLRLQMGRAMLHPEDRAAFGAGRREAHELIGDDGSRLSYHNGRVWFWKANCICPPDDEEPESTTELKTIDTRIKGSGV